MHSLRRFFFFAFRHHHSSGVAISTSCKCPEEMYLLDMCWTWFKGCFHTKRRMSSHLSFPLLIYNRRSSDICTSVIIKIIIDHHIPSIFMALTVEKCVRENHSRVTWLKKKKKNHNCLILVYTPRIKPVQLCDCYSRVDEPTLACWWLNYLNLVLGGVICKVFP